MMIEKIRQHPYRATGLGFFVLAIIFLWRVLWPPPGMALGGHDIRSLFYPWLTFAREAIFSGRLPLWDADLFSGYPFLSNPQVALFYLPTWPAILLPVRIGISWHVLFHLFVAAVGMLLFVRYMSRHWLGATLAALAFAFSGYAAARIWAGHIGLLATNSWLPWMLLAMAWSMRKKTAWAGILAGVPFGLAILAGHTTSLIYLGVAWGAFAVYLLVESRNWRLVLQQYVLAGLVGIGLSGVELLPLLEFSRVSARASVASFEFAAAYSLPPAHLITLLLPAYFGEPVRSGYWSVPTFEELTYYA
ncbi:MAG: 6-pyruvoyl-tetrahydropterin synthase-related protein, partial [Anaerolineae bacterium]